MLFASHRYEYVAILPPTFFRTKDVGFVYGTIPRKPAESLKQNVLWNLAKLGL
jgi:hypothetical protein